MSVVRFPARNAAAIFVREMPGDGWIVIARERAWLCGDQRSAFAEAAWLSENLSLPVRSYERHFARLNVERRR
jgi:hypothetical protein